MTLQIDEKIAELVGVFIGDGFTNQYSKHSIVEFSGHKDKEWEYFNFILIPLVRHFSKANPKIHIKNNSLRLDYYSKDLYLFLTKKLKLRAGYKTLDVQVPNYILKNRKLYHSFLRGIFDADGSIIWDKRKLYKRAYPRLSITTISKKLAFQIAFMLKSLGFNPKVYVQRKNNVNYDYHVDLYGFESFIRWIDLIGFSNNKHINRSCLSGSAGRV